MSRIFSTGYKRIRKTDYPLGICKRCSEKQAIRNTRAD
ncbi:hypothetical protein GI364_14540 [Alicyclobacillus sp. SO9]|nr:hypothetical protein GI364_14540 [Alicyclobacillus sp. SO9]